jgi:hypothetical protein
MRQTSTIMINPEMLTTNNVVAEPLSQGSKVGAGSACNEPSHGLARSPSTDQLGGRMGKQPVTPTSSNKRVSAEEVLRSFNTWAFKREHPSDPDLMQRVMSESIALAEPVSFVMYWGKGPRDRLDAPDIACLDYLASLCQRVSKVYAPGACFTLIFTDTHAKLNGYKPQATQGYFAAVESRARERRFSTCLLSQLTKAAIWETPSDPVTEVPEDIRECLNESAAKWYRGEGGVEHGALIYYKSNMLEKHAVEFAFPRSIFVTFSGSRMRSLYPNRLPIFYMYSLRRGFSIKPWFLSVDQRSYDGTPRQSIA